MGKIQSLLNLSRVYTSRLSPEIKRLMKGLPANKTLETSAHLRAAADWISAAQDAFEDGGVARSYTLVYKPFFNRKGWIPSYPETTGYIIPTLYDYAELSADDSIRKRAARMADWECDVQLPDGAVMGGTVDTPSPTPAVFNTGQVIFGWLRAFRETGEKRYLDSAIRAGEYLLRGQDRDGAWRKNLTDFATGKLDSYTYNTRTAWALLELSLLTEERRFLDAAVQNIEHSLTLQLPNGWFRSNCLYNPDAPLLHTIAYCTRGILEVGIRTGNERYIELARRPADALIRILSERGDIPGRLDKDWRPAVDYVCLTGVAQTGIIWGRLFEVTGDDKYMDALTKANEYLKRLQILDTGNPGLYGGLAGSHPVDGIYGQYEVLNWGVKFFMDSLMIEERITG